jgi:hypothetical protein
MLIYKNMVFVQSIFFHEVADHNTQGNHPTRTLPTLAEQHLHAAAVS